MNIGENIYRLRRQNNMSQGDLADMLDVSRQSVSKWENNSAVPDLDKLIKMASLFRVPLDALVQEQSSLPPVEKTSPIPEKLPEVPEKRPSSVPGVILLCCAVLVFLLTGLGGFLYIGAPLLICGILCLCLKHRRGLWCCWVVLFFCSAMLHNSTGVGINPFWLYIPPLQYDTTQVYRLITALVANALTALMAFWTLRSYLPAAISRIRTKKVRLLLGWFLAIVPYHVLSSCISAATLSSLQQQPDGMLELLSASSYLLDWVYVAAWVIMLIFTVACLQTKEKVPAA